MFVSRRTFGLADAQVPHSDVGTEERCAAVSNGGRCRPRDRAPPSLWAGDHRAYPLDTPKVTRARKARSTQITCARSRLPASLKLTDRAAETQEVSRPRQISGGGSE